MCRHLPDVDARGAKCFGEVGFAELAPRAQRLLGRPNPHPRCWVAPGGGLAFAANRTHRITLTRLPLDLEAMTLPAFCSACRYDCQHCRNSIGAKSPDCGRNVNASTCAMPSEALACALRAGGSVRCA